MQLECECKLIRHSLVNKANLIKDEYSNLKECYGNIMQFKEEVMSELVEISSLKVTVLNELLSFYYNKNIEIEKT